LIGRKKRKWVLINLFIYYFLGVGLSPSKDGPFVKVSAFDEQDTTRIIIDSTFHLEARIEKTSSYLMLKFENQPGLRFERGVIKSELIKSVGWSKGTDFCLLNISFSSNTFKYQSLTRKNPPQLIIEVREGKKPDESLKDDSRTSSFHRENESSELKDPREIRTVVIDPGHGGLEVGAKGKFGTLEKDITLQIALKLKAIIERNLSFRVILTREKDVDVSLENRAAVANNNRAHLFISIHTNSSYRKEASGSETYFLSLNATDEESRRLAYLENNSVEFEERISGGSEDELNMILWDMAQTAYIRQSSQMAESIQNELNFLLQTPNRGIKQAPFKVLTAVSCPAVLVEVAFISNPEEEKKLLTEEFQENIAQAIFRGVLNYLKSLT